MRKRRIVHGPRRCSRECEGDSSRLSAANIRANSPCCALAKHSLAPRLDSAVDRLTKVNGTQITASTIVRSNRLDRTQATLRFASVRHRALREVSRGFAVGGNHVSSSHFAHNGESNDRRARPLCLAQQRLLAASDARDRPAHRTIRNHSQPRVPRRDIQRVVRLPVPFAVARRRALPTPVRSAAPEGFRIRSDGIRARTSPHCKNTSRRAQRTRLGVVSMAAGRHPYRSEPAQHLSNTPQDPSEMEFDHEEATSTCPGGSHGGRRRPGTDAVDVANDRQQRGPDARQRADLQQFQPAFGERERVGRVPRAQQRLRCRRRVGKGRHLQHRNQHGDLGGSVALVVTGDYRRGGRRARARHLHPRNARAGSRRRGSSRSPHAARPCHRPTTR